MKLNPGSLVYLSGPYSESEDGTIDRHIANARKIAVTMWDDGYYVLCPHLNTINFEKDCGATYDQYIAGDLRMINGVDALVMLPGWQKSKGANLELEHAVKVFKPVYEWPNFQSPLCFAPSVLEEANAIVTGDRRRDYGHPLDNFSRTATFWSTILNVQVTAEQVALCMIGLKVMREVNNHKRDNLVDIAGYTHALQVLIEERERRASE